MRRRLVVAALLAGVVAGAAGAAVKADQGTPAASARAARPATIPIADPRRQGRLADGRYEDDRAQYRVHGAKIAATLPDPAGGPAWAIEVFDAERVTLAKPARTLAGAKVIGREHCAQLGRLSGGRFGWVYGDGRFHLNAIEDRLLTCTSSKRPAPAAQFAMTLRIADPAAPALTGSVVWGLAPGATAATISGTGGADGPATVAGGAFLRLGGADAKLGPQAQVTIAGKPVSLLPPGLDLPKGFQTHFPAVVPGSERIEARAPDPSGGPGWGLLAATTTDGKPCMGDATEIVGDRAGDADLRLGLFWNAALRTGECRILESPRGVDLACNLGLSYADEESDSGDAFLARARVQRRVLPGRTDISAQCRPDVVSVTIRTPRDTRTLVPSPVGHAVLAVYDGDFPAGTAQLVAHLRSGKTQTQPMPLGF